jgi:hypothetical protein
MRGCVQQINGQSFYREGKQLLILLQWSVRIKNYYYVLLLFIIIIISVSGGSILVLLVNNKEW